MEDEVIREVPRPSLDSCRRTRTANLGWERELILVGQVQAGVSMTRPPKIMYMSRTACTANLARKREWAWWYRLGGSVVLDEVEHCDFGAGEVDCLVVRV